MKFKDLQLNMDVEDMYNDHWESGTIEEILKTCVKIRTNTGNLITYTKRDVVLFLGEIKKS